MTTTTAVAKKLAYYRWLIFSILALGYVLVYFHRLSPGVMALDLMKSFGVGATIVGVLGSAYFYPYAIMQLPAGLLSDSLGPRKSVTIFLLILLSALFFSLFRPPSASLSLHVCWLALGCAWFLCPR